MTRKIKAKLSAVSARLVADSGAVTITAAVPEGDNAGPATFAGVAYSGGVVDRRTLSGLKLDADYIIDLDGMSSGRGVKANLDHKTSQRVGHLTNVVNDKQSLMVEGALSAKTQHREEVEGSAANGFTWDVSIEASLAKPIKLKKGESKTVNGREVSGPLYIFPQSTLTGLGFVSNGADEGNNIRIAATAAGDNSMTDLEKFAASLGVDWDNATDDQKEQLEKVYSKQGKPVEPVRSFSQIAEDERKDQARKEAITKLGRDALRDHPLYIDQIEKAANDAIESGKTADQFELELTRELRGVGGFRSNQIAPGRVDARVMEAALAMAVGLPDIEKHYKEHTLDAVDAAKLHRGFSIQQILLQEANGNGYQCRPGERIHPGNIRSILEYAFPPVTARLGPFSTATLPNILGEVANKMILAGYMESDQTWEEVAEVKSVSNFYTQNHYRMLDSLEYEEVGSGGELKHGTLNEETYTSQAKTYGKMLGITRTQIINDDLGAFNDIRARLGRGAAKKFSNVFWTAFIDNSTFFTAAKTNYISGATTDLGTDGVGLGLGVKAFRTMTSPSTDGSKRVGNDLNPSKLIVPPELEAVAEELYRNRNLDAVATGSANIYANRYRPVVQWRLSNSSYTGNSTTAWYMFGDEVRPILVTFLNGNRTPTVESTDADFDVLGIQFRGYHDFGCDKGEYLAGIKSKGAA